MNKMDNFIYFNCLLLIKNYVILINGKRNIKTKRMKKLKIKN